MLAAVLDIGQGRGCRFRLDEDRGCALTLDDGSRRWRRRSMNVGGRAAEIGKAEAYGVRGMSLYMSDLTARLSGTSLIRHTRAQSIGLRLSALFLTLRYHRSHLNSADLPNSEVALARSTTAVAHSLVGTVSMFRQTKTRRHDYREKRSQLLGQKPRN